jgi:hypothetical protein
MGGGGGGGRILLGGRIEKLPLVLACSLGLSATSISQNKLAISNQPAVFFSQNKLAPAISHQPTEQSRGTKQTWEGRQKTKKSQVPAAGGALGWRLV